jgi:mycothiol synthase
MTQQDLAERITEPWFDPDGFLLHDDDDGHIDGFCWTREHRDTTPPMGEIYVIGVRPDRHGLGLGRRLTIAGLDHLTERGHHVGMLYVEGDNSAARGLYAQLGFVLHHEDVAYG